jgi:hypothetical protein
LEFHSKQLHGYLFANILKSSMECTWTPVLSYACLRFFALKHPEHKFIYWPPSFISNLRPFTTLAPFLQMSLWHSVYANTSQILLWMAVSWTDLLAPFNKHMIQTSFCPIALQIKYPSSIFTLIHVITNNH